MAEIAKQGWLGDPAGRHEYRWFSQGTPTDLVKDGHTTSRDAISIPDPAVYQAMDLAEEPDTGRLLRTDDMPPPDYKLVNIHSTAQPLGPGFVRRVQTDDRHVWTKSAGAAEVLGVVLPWIIGGLFAIWFGLPFLIGCLLLSLLIALLGRARRRRMARRLSRG